MKKQFTISLILIFVLGIVPVNFSKAADLASRLKGRILLQVESAGEAWYINPDNNLRYYLGRPADAFSIMRKLGLGVSNKDFETFDNKAPKRLAGKILLKVESAGEAYYVNPIDLKMYYLGRPADAFQVMRELGLGITNNDLDKVLENGQIDTSNLKLLNNAEIIKQLKDSVVYIETSNGSGSGFIIESNGYILTNAHVVQGVSTANVILSNSNTFSVSVIGRDENIDLALLKVNKTGLKKSVLGDSDVVKQGDEIFTLGYPFGIKGDVSFKEGTISRKLKNVDYEYLEISADIHPGNSGGPLVNRYGQIVGVNTAVFGENIQGISLGETIKLAIPINIAKNILTDLKNGRNIVNKDWNLPQTTNDDSNTVTDFTIKVQCHELGKQKKEEDDEADYRSGFDSVKYGYSSKLNTCVYARGYGIWLKEGEYSHPYTSYQIWDLLTEKQLYRVEKVIDMLETITDEDEKMIIDFWAVYNVLIE